MKNKPDISPEKQELIALSRSIGNLSGRIGNYVGRVHSTRKNGKVKYQQRFAKLPSKYRKNNKKQFVGQRVSFTVTNDFVSFINRIPDIKKLWKPYALKNNNSSAYTAMHQANHELSTNIAPSERNIITPPYGSFTQVNTNIRISGNRLTGKGVTGKLISVIVLTDPVSNRFKNYRMLSLKEEINGDFEFLLDSEIVAQLSNYKRAIIYTVIITAAGEYLPCSTLVQRIKRGTGKAVIFFLPVVKTRLIVYQKPASVVFGCSHSPPLAA